MAPRPLLPPPVEIGCCRFRSLLLSGRNPRIRGFGWGRVGVGGRAAWHSLAPLLDPHPQPLPTRGRGAEAAPQHDRSAIGYCNERYRGFALPGNTAIAI